VQPDPAYARILARVRKQAPVGEVAALRDELARFWIDRYRAMPGSSAEVYTIELGTVSYHFDTTAERVVAVNGTSTPATAKRDSSRMRGWLRVISHRFAGRGDKGHLMSHAQGGGLDINLFPQRPDLNRGRSLEGRAYRELERLCAQNPGTFCFSALLYDDPTWVPAGLDYGVLPHAGQFRVERFSNAAD